MLERMETAAPPLVFVYLGNPPPKYARDSLLFASDGHDGRTILLTNVDHGIPPDHRYEIHRIDEWYDSTHFASFRENADFDPTFMEGFWFHVVERFFVLYQFMKKERENRIFHAELDVMVLDLHGVAQACDATGHGIFGVMDDASRALASLFYVNNMNDFEHFLEFALKDINMRNEMEMIGRYIQLFPERGHALPSNPYFENLDTGLAPSNVPDSIGLFDSNTFGHWLFGLDPKTIKYESKNHYRNEMVRFPIEKLQFRIGFRGRRMTVSLAGLPPRQLRTLHVHSKIVSRLTIRPVLIFYLWVNTINRRTTITHRKGWWASRLLDLTIGGRAFPLVKAISTVGFRSAVLSLFLGLAARGAVPMPNRQRMRLNELFPEAPLGKQQSVPIDVLLRVSDEDESLILEATRAIENKFPGIHLKLFADGAGTEISNLVAKSAELRGRTFLVGGEKQLAERVYLSSIPILVVRPHSALEVNRTLLTSEGVQLLQPSVKKNDSASRHARNVFAGLGLSHELDFADDWCLFQPDLVSSLFGGSFETIEHWATLGSTSASPSLSHSYGTWVWNKHRDRVALARKIVT